MNKITRRKISQDEMPYPSITKELVFQNISELEREINGFSLLLETNVYKSKRLIDETGLAVNFMDMCDFLNDNNEKKIHGESIILMMHDGLPFFFEKYRFIHMNRCKLIYPITLIIAAKILGIPSQHNGPSFSFLFPQPKGIQAKKALANVNPCTYKNFKPVSGWCRSLEMYIRSYSNGRDDV